MDEVAVAREVDDICGRCEAEFADHVENPMCDYCGRPGLSHELAEDRQGVYRACGDGYYEPSDEEVFFCPDKRGWFEAST